MNHDLIAAGHPRLAFEAAKFQEDPHWRDLVLFNEYFHGETGRGCGASHQTGWTGLVAARVMGSVSRPKAT